MRRTELSVPEEGRHPCEETRRPKVKALELKNVEKNFRKRRGEVLPGWMQAIATVSPVTYALEGSRAALLEGAGVAELWEDIWPLIIMGAVFVPLGLGIFHIGESYAKRTGKLKRSG